MFCKKAPSGLRKQARKRSGSCSRPGNKLVPGISPNKVDDDADSNLVSSSTAPSTAALKKGSSDVIPDSGHPGAAPPDGDTIPLKKKRSLKEVLRTRSRSLTRSLSWKKNKESSDVYEFVDSQTLERRSRSRSRSLSVSTIHSLKQDTQLAISNEQVTPITAPIEIPKSTPCDATPRPRKQRSFLKDRLLLTRPRSITKESDFQLTSVPTPASPPRSFGPPRITINEDPQDVVHDTFLVQSRKIKKLASPHNLRQASFSSSDEDAASRYAIPESYTAGTDKPDTRGLSYSYKPRVDYVLEERHWGSKAVRRIRSHQSDARSQSQASESTWIPTKEERYKMASAFIFGEEEFSTLSLGSTSMFTDETGFTRTTDDDTTSFVSESTGTATGVFSGVTEYTDDTGITTKTNDAGYATGAGDTSESSDMDTCSYTEGTSFVSSRMTGATDEMSMFDLGLNDSEYDTPVEKHAKHRKRYDLGLENGTPVARKDIQSRKAHQYKMPKRSNSVFLEVIADLRELRTFVMMACLPCHGH